MGLQKGVTHSGLIPADNAGWNPFCPQLVRYLPITEKSRALIKVPADAHCAMSRWASFPKPFLGQNSPWIFDEKWFRQNMSLGKNVFCSVNVDKIRGKRIFEIVDWPFHLSSNLQLPPGLSGWHYWYSSAQPSKGQCTISKNSFFQNFFIISRVGYVFSRHMICLYHF